MRSLAGPGAGGGALFLSATVGAGGVQRGFGVPVSVALRRMGGGGGGGGRCGAWLSPLGREVGSGVLTGGLSARIVPGAGALGRTGGGGGFLRSVVSSGAAEVTTSSSLPRPMSRA